MGEGTLTGVMGTTVKRAMMGKLAIFALLVLVGAMQVLVDKWVGDQ